MNIKELKEKEVDVTMSFEDAAITVDLYVDRLIDIFEEETDDEDFQGSILSMFIDMIEILKNYAMPDTITKFNDIMKDIKEDGWAFEEEGKDITDEEKPPVITILDPTMDDDIIDVIDPEKPTENEIHRSSLSLDIDEIQGLRTGEEIVEKA